MLHIGDLLDNKYRILSEVGHGGMSVVYLAINERANKTWAVKEVRKDGVMDFAAVKQGLVVETDMMKKLNHPHLPSIVDVIDTEDSFLIVMDYIEGKSLLKLLKTEGAQPEDKVIKWGKQICDVLGYLHRQKPPIIYRDMKPANVMLKPDGDIALIDFGTAREFKDRNMVEDTTCLGTRGYAAPEQFGGRGQTDARTDIYCLGATLYHLLTGHSPAEPPYEIKPLSYWIPQYAGSGLEKLILKCTQQDPSQRYQDCAELMYALEHYKDEDDAIRKKRKGQVRAFIAAMIVGCAGLAGALFCNFSEINARQRTYESYLSQAELTENLREAKPLIKQALELDAGGVEAYETLLNKAEDEIQLNTKLSQDSANDINECITSKPNRIDANIDILKAQNPDEYAEVMYNIGLWYFFMRDNSDADRQNANTYFKQINSEEYLSRLDTGKSEMLQIMSKIADYIPFLGNNKTGQVFSDGENYSGLYNDLKNLVSGDLKAKVGKDYYCLIVYKQVANWISEKVDLFRSDGITKEEMLELLQIIEDGINSLGSSGGNALAEEMESTRQTLDAAKKTVESLK